MPGRVFISCGQATPAECAAAAKIKAWFSGRGFRPYVAKIAQSILDVNSGIIDELKRSDFYVFVDFRRERLVPARGSIDQSKRYVHRGSLFTNQELAIVYLLRFDKVIFLQQEGVELNGLLRYMGANPATFARIQDAPSKVAALAAEWVPSYTRHFSLGEVRWSDSLTYADHTGQRCVRVCYVDIHNLRQDLGALNATARLACVKRPDDSATHDLDRSPLKCTGQPGYSQVIWPGSHACWDFLAVDMQAASTVYLNSALDSLPRQPVLTGAGNYELTYEIFAENFPVLKFSVKLCVADDPIETTKEPPDIVAG